MFKTVGCIISGIHPLNAEVLPPRVQPRYSCTDLLQTRRRKGTVIGPEQLRITALLFATGATKALQA